MSISFTMYPDELVSLQGLAEAYGLTFRMPYDSVVYLSGDDFVVTVAVDMDGAAIWYYDIKDDSKVTQYALGLLLFQKRHPVSAPPSNDPDNRVRVRYELQWAISVLANYGIDVLRGSRDWFSEYTWTVFDTEGSLRDRILTAVNLRKAQRAHQAAAPAAAPNIV